jgi:hypothetical protein
MSWTPFCKTTTGRGDEVKPELPLKKIWILVNDRSE